MPMSDYMKRVRAKVGNDLLEIPSVSILTFDERDRVLLVHHADTRLWTTPGGAVEPYETPANAAVREMWEETGLHVELSRVLGIYGGPGFGTTYSNGDEVSFLMSVFEGVVVGGELGPNDDESLEVGWFGEAETRELATQGWVDEVLGQVFADRTRLHFAPPTWSPPGAS